MREAALETLPPPPPSLLVPPAALRERSCAKSVDAIHPFGFAL